MVGYGTIKLGARGSSVSELQTLLNRNGFNLKVDGIFGNDTQRAVRDYQARMGLAVDGIAGTNTWGSLTGSGGSGAAGGASGIYSPTGSSGYSGFSYSAPKPQYSPSAGYQSLLDQLAELEGNKPEPYDSKYQAQIDELLAKIQNREPFSYDFNADPLYQQYKGNYMQLGKQAMQDATGSAAALTGGYGNSYAATAGNQAYQQYTQKINDVIPTLRDAAYGMYRDQGQDMYNEMGMLRGLDDTDYGRYRDEYGNWATDRDYYSGKKNAMYDEEYGAYMDAYNRWLNERDFEYQRTHDAQQQANWEKEYQMAANKASGGSGGGKKSGGKSTTDWDALLGSASNAQIQAILYGYTAEGRDYMAKIRKEIGDDGLNALRKKYGGKANGGR